MNRRGALASGALIPRRSAQCVMSSSGAVHSLRNTRASPFYFPWPCCVSRAPGPEILLFLQSPLEVRALRSPGDNWRLSVRNFFVAFPCCLYRCESFRHSNRATSNFAGSDTCWWKSARAPVCMGLRRNKYSFNSRIYLGTVCVCACEYWRGLQRINPGRDRGSLGSVLHAA